MIRKRIPRQDDPAIFALVEELLLPYASQTKPGLRLSLNSLRERLKPCITYVEAGTGGRVSGFIAVQPDKGRMNVHLLAVHRRDQGRGLGAKLMLQAERTAGFYGCREVVLWVDEANAGAQRFYGKLGYVAVDYHAQLRCYMLRKMLL